MNKLASWKSLPLFVLAAGSLAMAEESKFKLNVGIRAGYHMHMSSDKTKETAGKFDSTNPTTGKAVNGNDELALKDFHLDAAKIVLSGDFSKKFGYKFKLDLGKAVLKKTAENPAFGVQIALLNYKICEGLSLQIGYDQPLVGGLENDAGPVKTYSPTVVQNWIPGKSAMARLKFNVDEKSFVALDLANKNTAPLRTLVGAATPSAVDGEVRNQQMPLFGLAWFGHHDLGFMHLTSNASFHMSSYKEQKNSESATGLADLKTYAENYLAISACACLLDQTLDIKPAYLRNAVSYKAGANDKELTGNVSSLSIEAGYTAMDLVRPFVKWESSARNLGHLEAGAAKTDKMVDVTGVSAGLEVFPDEGKATNFHLVYNYRGTKFGKQGAASGFAHINDQDTDTRESKTTATSEIIVGFAASI